MLIEKHTCILDGCNKEISLFRNFCSKECERAFFKKYPELKKEVEREGT